MTLTEEIAPAFSKKMLKDLVKQHRKFWICQHSLEERERLNKYTKIALSDMEF